MKQSQPQIIDLSKKKPGSMPPLKTGNHPSSRIVIGFRREAILAMNDLAYAFNDIVQCDFDQLSRKDLHTLQLKAERAAIQTSKYLMTIEGIENLGRNHGNKEG